MRSRADHTVSRTSREGRSRSGVGVDRRELLTGLGLVVVLVAGVLFATSAPATTNYIVTTLAGSVGTSGTASASEVVTSAARFAGPTRAVTDGEGNLYVCDTANQCIRKITAAGTVSIFAGSTSRVTGRTNGTGTAARFSNPSGIAIRGGILYVADTGNNQIRSITTTSAIVALFAGNPLGYPGPTAGVGTNARFNGPSDLAVDAGTGLYVADTNNNELRRISVPTRNVGGAYGGRVLVGSAPRGVAVDSGGNIYVAATGLNQIIKYNSSAATQTVWGAAAAGADDGEPSVSRFSAPQGLCADSTYLYLADTGNQTVRRINLASPYTVTTIAGTAGSAGTANGTGSAARFDGLTGVTMNGADLVITDRANHALRNVHTLTTWEISPVVVNHHGSISPSTTQTVEAGSSSPTFTITPDIGYYVRDVFVDGMAIGPRSTFKFTNVTADHTLAVDFAWSVYRLVYSYNPLYGHIDGTNPQSVPHGERGTTVTPVPVTGYHFVDWSDGSTANPRVDYNVTADATVTANFAANSYHLAYAGGANGTLSGATSQTVNYGTSGTAVTAVPNAGYHFVQWSDGSTANPRTDTNVTGEIGVTAEFAADSFTLTYSAGAGGGLTGSASQSVAYGGSGTAVTAVANAGYHFTGWSDGITTATRTDANVSHDIAVVASFAANGISVVSASAPSNTSLDVVFSEQLSAGSVSAAGFSVTGVSVTGAALRPDGVTVRLATGAQQPGSSHVVTVASSAVSNDTGDGVASANSAVFTSPAGAWTIEHPTTGVVVSFATAFDGGTVSAVVPGTTHADPSGFRILTGSYFDISATTDFDTGQGFDVTVPYDAGSVSSFANLRLFHWENGGWVDVTTSVDRVHHTVTGHSHSFSDYTIAADSGSGTVSTPASSPGGLALLALGALGLAGLAPRRIRSV